MERTGTLRLPTRLGDWRLMGRTIRLVLGMPLYATLALLAAVGSLSVFVLSRNLQLLVNVIVLGELPLEARVSVLVGLFPLIGTAYTLAMSVVLILTGILVGIDIALVTYHLREHRLTVGEGSGGVVGIVLGTLGAGCAACGSAVLAGLFSLVGAGSLLTLLPLEGLEFSLVALGALVLSIYWLADGLKGGMIRGCPVASDGKGEF